MSPDCIACLLYLGTYEGTCIVSLNFPSLLNDRYYVTMGSRTAESLSLCLSRALQILYLPDTQNVASVVFPGTRPYAMWLFLPPADAKETKGFSVLPTPLLAAADNAAVL